MSRMGFRVASAMLLAALAGVPSQSEASGTVPHFLAWGLDRAGENSAPAALPEGEVISAISAGVYHNLALKANGTVIAWPEGGARTAVPPGLTGVVAISAGMNHSLALTADGTIVSWGEYYAGELPPPPPLIGVKAIAAGGNHSLAIASDNTVVAWPANDGGTVPGGLTNVVAIAAGFYYSLALRSDGTVVGWGTQND